MPSHDGACRPAAVWRALAVAVLVGGCAHGSALLSQADGSARDRDFRRALDRYHQLGAEECAPGGSERLCCAALRGEAETLLATNEQQHALVAFDRAREQCPTDLDLRRRQYQVLHAGEPEPEGGTVPVTFQVTHVLAGLGDRERLLWVGLFLDGELVGHDPLAAHAGTHELEAEALVAPDGGGTRVRLRARQPVTIARGAMLAPLVGAVRLVFGERTDSSLPESRLTLDMDPVRVGESDPPLPAPSPQHPDLGLRMTGHDPQLPAELAHEGQGWKVRTEICVGPEGRVASVAFLDTAPAHDPRSDAVLLEALRRWRYGAYRIDGVLHGFCHPHEVNLAR